MQKERALKLNSVELNSSRDKLIILDQSLLPWDELYLEIDNEYRLADAIKSLKVRGAPAIGIAASLGIAVIMKRRGERSTSEFTKEFDRVADLIISTRPTAVNLINGISRLKIVLNKLLERSDISVKILEESLLLEAEKIKEEDASSNLSIAESVLTLIKPGSTILTYCNAGELAVSELGTALGAVYLAKSRGLDIKVIACETRPLLQGARLTTYELKRGGIDTTLICDNMVSYVMSKGMVDAVITGCDTIALNGDVANKIGTSMVSITASHYKVPHYVAGPSSTIDKRCKTGKDVVIEQRDPSEITTKWFSRKVSAEGVDVCNPAFDITPANLIDAIITEKGIFRYPFNFNKHD